VARKKNAAAVELGRRGGKKKTTKPKGLAALPEEKRKEIARAGVEARRQKAKERRKK
jgi:hypothetical protein